MSERIEDTIDAKPTGRQMWLEYFHYIGQADAERYFPHIVRQLDILQKNEWACELCTAKNSTSRPYCYQCSFSPSKGRRLFDVKDEAPLAPQAAEMTEHQLLPPPTPEGGGDSSRMDSYRPEWDDRHHGGGGRGDDRDDRYRADRERRRGEYDDYPSRSRDDHHRGDDRNRDPRGGGRHHSDRDHRDSRYRDDRRYR